MHNILLWSASADKQQGGWWCHSLYFSKGTSNIRVYAPSHRLAVYLDEMLTFGNSEMFEYMKYKVIEKYFLGVHYV